ncbi:MAG TPA: M6 family metalloprotease domain-containing protein [Verrucomicrobiae bacterium]|jgi:M6 family metalloprotease-like protein
MPRSDPVNPFSRTVLVVLVVVASDAIGCGIARASELTDYRTVATAITTTIRTNGGNSVTGIAYLGVFVTTNRSGKLVIGGIDDDSPAAKAGLAPNDVLVKAGGNSFRDVVAFREWLQTRAPGDTVELSIQRGRKSLKLSATLDTASHPLKPSDRRAFVGITYGEPDDRGAVVRTVITNSPAAKAGVKVGDVLVKVGDSPMSSQSTLTDVLTEKGPGDSLELTVLRGEKEKRVSVRLGASAAGPASAVSTALPTIWKRDTYRLAVIGIEYPDTKMNPKVAPRDWDEAMFSTGIYANKSNVTGQAVHGSVADYYREVSCGKLRVTGKVFAPVEVGKKRGDYAGSTRDSDKGKLLTDAIDKLLEREGKGALKDFDGLIFIYAGERYPKANRGTIYWPHRASVTHGGKRWSYYICAEGGKTMASISVFCHEFGHMLGLPDLYARPENPGSEGLGVWCLMSNERGAGKPQHPSAWCKEQLGWLAPAVLDPTVPQRLMLDPVEGSTNQCFKVLVRADGSEYLLLEYRRRTGFDASLPAEGMLIWHIVGRRPILEESHGVEGPLGPRVFLGTVPYPSRANDSFTPYTTPSSRSQLGGGLPVHITNIRQHADGRVSFQIGYEFE